mgnify:CR=1 FL=1
MPTNLTRLFMDLVTGQRMIDYLFCTSTKFVYSTYSILRPLYFDLFTASSTGQSKEVEVKICQKGRSKI